ncbi:MAG TPA: phenylalanine--tRNA ligase subunit beta [Candidatus Pacearchaeota archaeon]|nr:phenylalanine--tRNA ligase subunit beta [Candidatus Pacearchaeota archaeon]
MIISYNFLNSFFKEKLPNIKEVCDKLTLHAFEVELPQKHNDDYTFEVKVLPDRGSDALSHLGIARECSAIFGLELNPIKSNLIESKSLDINKFLSVEVKSDGCKRYSSRVLTGISIKESPEWLKNRLKACGISPINNVVDVTNYVMLELGQPLHAFDYEKLSQNKKIIVDKAKKDEKFITLSNQEMVLDENILTIRDEEDALAIAGIKGGLKAEITENTKAIVIESANFEGSLISKTSKKIKLRTDSSYRFEHNIDPELTVIALDRAASLIQEITKAEILKGVIDIYNEKEKPKKVCLHLDYLNKLLGLEIDLKDIKRILRSLGFEILKEEKDKIQVLVPSFRKDILIEENLIEEIGRIYGYDKINPVLPISGIKIKRNESLYFADNLRLIFKELQFSEVYNYPFLGKKDKEIFNLSKLIEIQNPITVDSEYLAPSLIPNLVKNLKLNLKFEKDIKIYEIGKGFFKNGSVSEKKLISGLIFEGDYPILKGYLEAIFNNFNISHIEYIPNGKESFLSKKKSAIIKVNKKEVGVIGHLSGYVLDGLNLNVDPVLFELDFDALKDEIINENEFMPIYPYPVATRDITVIVPSNAYIEDIMEIIKISEVNLIKNIDLLDLYNDYDENLKSATFRIFLQSDKRGLENKEINEIRDKIISNLMQNPEWEVKQ